VKKKKIIIIGAGIVGLSAAKILSKNNNVTLVESSPNLGGFLNSIKFKNFDFDLGTHFLRETNNDLLNNILFKKIKKDWINLKFLKSGNFYKKKIIEHNQFINLREEKKFFKILNEILKNKRKKNFKNEEERCLLNYGKLVTNNIIKPIIKRYFNLELKNVPLNFTKKFGLNRFNIDDQKKIKKLKKEKKILDDVLSYKYNYEGLNNKINFYPKHGGINNFVDYFVNKKIKVYIKSKLNKIIIKNNIITHVYINKKKISSDYIIWTAGTNALREILNQKKEDILFSFFWEFIHIKSKQKFKSNCYYLNIHNDKNNIHRITIYKNLQSNSNNRITVETIKPNKVVTNDVIIKKFLKKINLINKNQNIKILGKNSVKINILKKSKSKVKYPKNLIINDLNFKDASSQEQKIEKLYYNIKKII